MNKNSIDIEIADGVYWVGLGNDNGDLQCNPYLIVDNGEGVLVDPGSVLDFEYVLKRVTEIIPLKKIKYVVAHHQDPDLCASLPLFEKQGANFTVVTHWRTKNLLQYYGIKSEYYLVDANNYRLTLKSGRVIQFLPTPYLHFPGAIASYDTKSKTLFSGDLFGAISEEWNLYAKNNYIERMKTFHEHYMPSNDILRPVMEMFLSMDIERIAPQHGSVIHEDVETYIKALRDLECGYFLNPVRKSIKESGGFAAICTMVLKRYAAIFSQEEVAQALDGYDVTYGDSILDIVDHNYVGVKLWESMFEIIYRNKGIRWLLIVEPMVSTIIKEYDLPLPKIFQSKLRIAQQESLLLKEEMSELKELNEQLSRNIDKTQGKISTCPVTGLYNEVFFKEYLKTSFNIAELESLKEHKSLMIIGVDEVSRIKYLYGESEYDSLLRTLVYILSETKNEKDVLFRLNGTTFACYMPDTKKEDASKIAEQIRNEVKSSNKFIEDITVSVGVAEISEIKSINIETDKQANRMEDIAMSRLRIARSKGGNLVSSESDIFDLDNNQSKILLVDNDLTHMDMLKSYLINQNYDIVLAKDGDEAFEMAEKEMPDLIVTEIMLPKIDGFVLCDKLSLHSSTKNIPFIITSDLKTEDSVKRALSFGIEHYFKKPYMLTELMGIIDLKLGKNVL